MPDRAADLERPSLSSPDAIHLASANTLVDDLAAIVTYDERLISAAAFLGLDTASPRRTADSCPPVNSQGVIFDIAIAVTLKPVVNDPQGLVVHSGLVQLGFLSVSDVRVGKYIQLKLDAPDEDTARVKATQMCEQLLRNPVIEDYRIGLEMQLEPAG